MLKNKINSLQLSSILIDIMLASFLGTGIFAIIKKSGIDAYLSVIIGGIIGISLIILFLYIFNYKENLNFKEKIIDLFGKHLGNFINILIIFIVFTMAISSTYNLMNFITSQFLPETPPIFIGLVFAFLVILINSKGFEVISRVCLIICIICCILFFVTAFGLLPEFDINNLKPFLEFGLSRPIKGSAFVICFNIIPVFLLLVIPKNNLVDKEKFNKYLLFAYVFSIFLMFLVIILTLGDLGIHLASIYQYPEYITLKNIKIFGFLDRIENFITLQWLFGLFTNITIAVYFLSNSIKSNYKGIILPIIISLLLVFSSLIIFPNNTIFNNYIYKYSLIFRMILIIIILIISIKIFVRKKTFKIT